MYVSEEIMYFVLVALAIILVAAVVIAISRSMGSKVSPFLLFGIVDIFFGLLILSYALFDFHTATGEFAGILGTVALMIGEPVVLVLLLADVIVWLIKRER